MVVKEGGGEQRIQAKEGNGIVTESKVIFRYLSSQDTMVVSLSYGLRREKDEVGRKTHRMVVRSVRVPTTSENPSLNDDFRSKISILAVFGLL